MNSLEDAIALSFLNYLVRVKMRYEFGSDEILQACQTITTSLKFLFSPQILNLAQTPMEESSRDEITYIELYVMLALAEVVFAC
jgi:hypothetical protein